MVASGSSMLSTIHGISIGSLITGGGVWAAVAMLIGIVLKGRVPMRKMKLDADERLREDLMKRVDKLEADAAAQAILREVERTRHEAEIAIMRHRVNNSDQCLDALLLLLKTSPEKVDQAVQHIEAMRARQRKEIAIEKGAQAGAKEAAVAAVIPAASAT